MSELHNIPGTEYIQKVVYWDDVEKDGEEKYDESFLATLRNELKGMEQDGKSVVIVPKRFSNKDAFWGFADSEIMSEEREEAFFEVFTATMLHVARRIKDCNNVVGFSYPDFENDWELLRHYSKEQKENFKAVFQKKHSHYIFVE